MIWRTPIAVLTMTWATLSGAEELTSSSPWRLQDALALPTWLSFGIEQRTRYETLDHQFRAGGSGGDQAVSFRTILSLEAVYGGWRLGGEFIDSRITADDRGTPIDTTLVDEAELLQAYLGWGTKDLLATGLSADIKGGRQTIDLGSQRLVARDPFRNTHNAFTGLDARLESPGRWQVHSFFVLPVFRLPDPMQDIAQVQDIREGRLIFDREDPNTYFWGVYSRFNQLPWHANGELYVLGLRERTVPDLATRNRRLYTPGIRWFRDPTKGQLDFEIEGAYQVGTSRRSANTRDLDHAAHFEHAQIGYTFDLPWMPRFLAQYDYASGDHDPGPGDGNDERFDTLFGARRFEFGPTGIWGAFTRSNISSPGYRLIVKPREDLSAFIGHRLFWLAEARDAWIIPGIIPGTPPIQDTTGRSGNFIGHQIEASIAWSVIPQNLQLEAGWAHLIKGEIARDAATAPPDKSDSNYFYVQTTVRF